MAAVLSCGGAKKGEADSPDGVGQSRADGVGPSGPIDAGPPPDAAPPPSAVTFVLRNDGKEELALNMDRGYGGVLQAYSGKPPKAKSILMFPTFCTASCEMAEEGRCPVCPQPEKVKDIRDAQKLEKIAPGATLEVPWDGNVLVYEKTKGTLEGKTKKCKCWRPEAAPPETYTVKACGLRLSTTVEKSSQLSCVTGEMTLPVTDPVRVELSFAK
jgi:hypothetical protein